MNGHSDYVRFTPVNGHYTGWGFRPPMTHNGHPNPIKHRPDGYVAGHNQPRATPITIGQNAQDVPVIDINLILDR